MLLCEDRLKGNFQMIILGIDTSGRDGSLALCSGDASSFEVLDFAPLAGGMYSAQLVPQLASALERCNLTNADIELFAVASGPGSFTGLRVGLSAVKALAEVLKKPVVALTVLEAIAVSALRAKQGEAPKRVIAALDAQRNEVFAGEYEPRGHDVVKITESVVPMVEFTTWLSARVPVPVTYSPDAGVEEKVRASGSPAEKVARPGADVIARLGLQRYMEGKTVSVDELDAEYIRRSDAEIFAKK